MNPDLKKLSAKQQKEFAADIAELKKRIWERVNNSPVSGPSKPVS